jgi:hypothetical protein
MDHKPMLNPHASSFSSGAVRHGFLYNIFVTFIFLSTVIAAPRLNAQSLFPSSASSTTPGLLQLQTTDPGLTARASYFSSDLIGQPTGEYLVQAFDAPVSISGVITGANIRLYMGQPAGDLGAIFPKVKLLLNGPSGTPICTMSSATALASTIQPQNFIRMACNSISNVPITPSDRYYLWVGFDLSSSPTISTQVQIAVGNVARGFGSPNISIGALATPSISSINPASGSIGDSVNISGSSFGATRGAGSVSFNGIPAAISNWTDTQIQAQVPPGAATGSVSVKANGMTSNGTGFTVFNPLAAGPGLQLSIADTPLQINLTSPQILDWIHWGRISSTVPDRKNGTPLIGDFTAVNGAQAFPSFSNIGFSWSDGNHPASVSESTEDIETFNTASGFQITVPADTTVKTLNLYAEVFFGQGILHASLSDGSSADINDQSVIDSDIGNKVYSIDFRAASAGQTLTVTFSGTATSSGVGLQAATLTPHLPVVVITSPSVGQSFASAATIPAAASASQLDNQLTDVSLRASNGTILDGAASPLTANLGPLAGGHYSVTASATDSAPLTNSSSPVEFDVIGQGGSLFVERNDIASPVNLTAGPVDWVLWGPQNTGDFVIQNPGDIVARKAGVQPLISEFKPIGSHRIQQWSFSNNILFTDSNQNFSSSGSQLVVAGAKDGYEITVPADTTSRALNLYVGASSARSKITAFLSDGSAPVITDTSFDFPDASDIFGFPGTSVFTIDYSAASAGQTLTVRYTMDFDYGNGQIDLLAAASFSSSGSSGTSTGSAPQITSLSPNMAPTNTKVTINGSNFGASQGESGVYFAGINPQVMNWSDTSIDVVVPSSVPDGNTVQVEVFTANGTSNSVNFTVPAYQIFPSTLVLLVGQSKSVTAKDSQHNVVSGLSWSTSDPSIVSVSADDPALITGVAPGTATVYAGDVPFQVTVYAGTSLPPGTVLWSASPSPGATGFSSLIPVVPSDTGIDVLGLDDAGFISAFSADGELRWRQKVLGVEKVIADFSGNALVNRTDVVISPVDGTSHSRHKISKVDPNTGDLTDFYTFADKLVGPCTVFPPSGGSYQSQCFDDHGSFERAVPDTTGVLFVQENTIVTAVDMTANQSLGSATLDQGTTNQSGTPQNVDPVYGQIIVAGDGNAYVPYVYGNQTTSNPSDKTVAVHTVSNLALLSLSSDGSSTKTVLHSWTADHTETTLDALPVADQAHTFFAAHSTDSGIIPSIALSSAITNADSGAAVFASIGSDNLCSDSIVGSYTVDGDPTLHTFLQSTGCGFEPERMAVSLAAIGTVGTQFDAQIKGFQPTLQQDDGSFIGITRDNSLATVAQDGSVPWQIKINPDTSGNAPAVQPLYATADGRSIATSTFKSDDGITHLGTLYTMDESGNVINQTADTGMSYSWTGRFYSGANGLSRIEFPATLSQATFAAVGQGNPSGNGTAVPGCSCIYQISTDDQPVASLSLDPVLTVDPIAALGLIETPSVSAFLPPPLICPICNLTPPSCVTIEGTQSTYVLIVGDPGLGGHNVSNLFNLAAQQKANDLQAQGHRVVACRASSIQDFDNALLNHGFIDGGIVFFGHSGPFEGTSTFTGEKIVVSALGVGENSGADTNVTFANVSLLSNVRTAHNGSNNIGPNAAILLSGCNAGLTIRDFLAGADISVAQMIANQTQRGVFAYEVGLYFSTVDAAHDSHFSGVGLKSPPNALPMYMVPEGTPGHKPAAIAFTPR